jgi:hypothetical protein
VNDRPTLLAGTSGTLEDLLLRVLADTHKRGPGRYPICPVCDQPMAVEVEVDCFAARPATAASPTRSTTSGGCCSSPEHRSPPRLPAGRCHNAPVQLTARVLLGAAGLVMRPGCAVPSAFGNRLADDHPIIPPGTPSLDRNLRLSLPQRRSPRSTLRRFAADRVRVTTVHQPPPSRLLLDLAAGQQGKLDVALVEEGGLALPAGKWPRRTDRQDPGAGTEADPRALQQSALRPRWCPQLAKDYSVIGFATTKSALVDPPGSWRRLFQYARAHPHRVGCRRPRGGGRGGDARARPPLELGQPGRPCRRQSAARNGSPASWRSAVGSTGARSAVAPPWVASGVGFRKPSSVHFVPTEGTIIHMQLLRARPGARPGQLHAFLKRNT